MSQLLTNNQQKELLLLTDSKWNRLCSDMKKHYKLGTCMPSTYKYLLVLTNEQWHTVEQQLTNLRSQHKESLTNLRKTVRLEASRTKKKSYMRDYMRSYREKKGAAPYGQVSNQDSS